jgi:hypothetical protein
MSYQLLMNLLLLFKNSHENLTKKKQYTLVLVDNYQLF